MSKTTFKAWVGLDATAGDGNLEYQEVEAKAADPDDIDVKVLYCGLCGSDVSGLSGHFGPILPPRVCGHEIVGEVTRVGPEATAYGFKVGDLVGVGAQCDSCRECEWCESHEEQYCRQMTFTYGAPIPRGAAKGKVCQGGFGEFWRGSARFAVRIPAGLDPAAAAPLLCAGITVYSPLKEYGAGTKAKRVGVIGIGGLGHLAIIIARAMGAQVTAISRGEAKREDAMALGAQAYIPTGENLKEDFRAFRSSLDLIICTINPKSLPINDYLALLRPKGRISLVGIVPQPLTVETGPLISSNKGVSGSPIGSPSDLKELLELVAAKGIKPWVQVYGFSDINKALVDFKKGLPKYRIVLSNVETTSRI